MATMDPLTRFLASKPLTVRRQIMGLAWLPVFALQFVNLVSWLAAKPVDLIGSAGFQGVQVPPEARSFYPNHGSPVFNEHGTIAQEPLVFAFWVGLFLLTFALFVWTQKQLATLGDS